MGGKTQAMNTKGSNPQTLGAVVGARNQPKKINWNKIIKIVGFTVAGLAALETIHSLIGGFTDFKAGSYSIGRAIKNSLVDEEALKRKILYVIDSFSPIINAVKQEKYKEAYIQEYGGEGIEYDDEVFVKYAAANLSELLSRVRIDKISSFEKKKGESDENFKACASHHLLDNHLFRRCLRHLHNYKKIEKESKRDLEFTTDGIIVFGNGEMLTVIINGDSSLTFIRSSREDETNIIDKFTLMPPKDKKSV